MCAFNSLSMTQGVPALPEEIIDHVLAYLVSDTHAFSKIAAFSLVSYRLRQMALRKYFAELEIDSAAHWDNVCKIAGVPSWVK